MGEQATATIHRPVCGTVVRTHIIETQTREGERVELSIIAKVRKPK